MADFVLRESDGWEELIDFQPSREDLDVLWHQVDEIDLDDATELLEERGYPIDGTLEAVVILLLPSVAGPVHRVWIHVS